MPKLVIRKELKKKKTGKSTFKELIENYSLWVAGW